MTVGVIVPVYGPAPYLEDALAGVLGQSPAPDEVIVVDDGSPAAVRVPAPFASRCRVLRRDLRGGPGPARDTALAAIATDWIACADADDVWRPGKLAAQLRALERFPEAVLCFGTAEIVGPDGRATGERWPTLTAGLLEPALLGPALYERNPIPTSSVIARRDAVVAAGGFSGPPLCEDWSLWLRLIERGGSFVCAPDAVISYRRHGDGLTADVRALAESSLLIHEAHAGLVDEAVRRRVRAGDLVALARGFVRERQWGNAGSALRDAASLTPLPARERLLRTLVTVPGVRAALGRRAPYSRRGRGA
ncbi:MAG TPA: glycosyltransferase family 2 protein [Solirubrobacteraceae bacterium]|jgi:glycosyltransferase involved in cell wall biosynthesis|nr:glycosyltransferase family 2 protein [Solirubrobacteraceae bacterium]